jgi:hypothetical protein
MLLVMITFACAFFILTDLIPAYQNKQWKLFWVYSAMMALVYVLTIFIALGIKLPSPAVPLRNLITAIFGIYPE